LTIRLVETIILYLHPKRLIKHS